VEGQRKRPGSVFGAGQSITRNREGPASPLYLEATMLVVTVKENEQVLIGDNVSVTVVEIRGKQIRLGIQAPADVLILREKLAKKEEA